MRSIAGFVDLREKFLLQFQNLLPQKRTHIECHDIKQGNRESLDALLTRYIYECQKVPNLNEDQKISGFIHAINPQRHPTLVRRLRRDVPPTFAKVQQETYDYLRGGEDSAVTPTCGWGKDRSWRDDNDSFRDGSSNNFRNQGFIRRNSGGGYPRNDRPSQDESQGYNRRDRYTTRKWNNESFNIIAMLTKTPKEILLQERLARSFPDPQPLGENTRRDKSKFCIYHDDYGHDTNRCRDLAELISEAFEQGKLDHLLAQGATSANAMILPESLNSAKTQNTGAVLQPERKAPAVKNLGVKLVEKRDNMQDVRIINMVELQSGMSALQVAAQTAVWRCPPITFPPIKLSGELDKPVVISCRIADCGIIIMKVHVDSGSSVDVMYEKCFNKLPDGIKSALKPTAVSLAGFSGESTWPIGQLELKLELVDDHDEQLRRQAMLNLYIMRNQSRFNMILGRTALRMFGAISSTVHGMLKFSAENGVGTLHSAAMDPLCAIITLRENLAEENAVLAYA